MLIRAPAPSSSPGRPRCWPWGRSTPAAAQKQTVVIYTAIENEQIAEYKKAYEKTLPNVDVKMLRLSTGDIAARFMAEKDNMQADVIWGVGATNMLQFKNAGLLEAYAPKGLERIQPLFRDRANPPAWVGLDIYMSAFCFNTKTGRRSTACRTRVLGPIYSRSTRATW